MDAILYRHNIAPPRQHATTLCVNGAILGHWLATVYFWFSLQNENSSAEGSQRLSIPALLNQVFSTTYKSDPPSLPLPIDEHLSCMGSR